MGSPKVVNTAATPESWQRWASTSEHLIMIAFQSWLKSMKCSYSSLTSVIKIKLNSTGCDTCLNVSLWPNTVSQNFKWRHVRSQWLQGGVPFTNVLHFAVEKNDNCISCLMNSVAPFIRNISSYSEVIQADEELFQLSWDKALRWVMSRDVHHKTTLHDGYPVMKLPRPPCC